MFRKKSLFGLFIFILLIGVSTRALAGAADKAPPPDERTPQQTMAVLILAAHERDTDALMECVDVPAFHEQYLEETKENPPQDIAMFETSFAGAVNALLEGAAGKKLDDMLGDMDDEQKFRVVEFYINAYTEVEKKENGVRVVKIKSDGSRKVRLHLQRAQGAWRIFWIEPPEEFLAHIADARPGGPVETTEDTTTEPEPEPEPEPETDDDAPIQVLIDLILSLDSLDARTLSSLLDLKGIYDRLSEKHAVLQMIDFPTFEALIGEAAIKFAQTLKKVIPPEFAGLTGENKNYLAELLVRSQTKITQDGDRAKAVFTHPDKPGKKYKFSMKRKSGQWMIDWIDALDNIKLFE